MKKMTHQEAGRRGGKARSAAKAEAARRNAQLAPQVWEIADLPERDVPDTLVALVVAGQEIEARPHPARPGIWVIRHRTPS